MLAQGLAEVHPTETPVADMKVRAARAIRDDEYGGEGWAQMTQRVNKGIPEVAKAFLKEKFQEGEETASAKVTPVECEALLRAQFPEDEECWLKESQGKEYSIVQMMTIHTFKRFFTDKRKCIEL